MTKQRESSQGLNDQMQVRRQKVEELSAAGFQPFAAHFKPDHQAGALHADFEQYDKDELANKNIYVAVAGRLMYWGQTFLYNPSPLEHKLQCPFQMFFCHLFSLTFHQ